MPARENRPAAGDTAKQMVLGTVLGSAHLLAQSGKEPQNCGKMVTSPGGTTAEAIQTFEKEDSPKTIYKAVKSRLRKIPRIGPGPNPSRPESASDG